MASELEQAYVSLRQKILYGQIPPGHAITVKCTADHEDLGERKARQVLNALAADGYLHKTRFSFSVAVFSHEQVEEWRQLLCAFAEIGAGRLILDQDARLEEFRCHVTETLEQFELTDERFYFAGLGLCTIVLGGPKSGLSRLAAQLLPQAFFRLLWLADSHSPAGGALLAAARRLIEVAPRRSVKEAKAACGIYFDGIAQSLHAQLDLRNQSVGAGEFGRKANLLIEPRLTGHTVLIGAPAPATPHSLIPELRDASPASLNFTLNHC